MAIREREQHKSHVVHRGRLYRDDLEDVYEILSGQPDVDPVEITYGDFTVDKVIELAEVPPSKNDINMSVTTAWNSDSHRSLTVVVRQESPKAHIMWRDHGDDDWRAAADLIAETLSATEPWLSRIGRLGVTWFVGWAVATAAITLGNSESTAFPALALLALLAFVVLIFVVLARTARGLELAGCRSDRRSPVSRLRSMSVSQVGLILTALSIPVSVLASWFFGRS